MSREGGLAGVMALEEVSFGYPGGGSGSVLRDCSLSLPAGTLTMLLGPNGIGKTTLLHLLLGWLRPEKGRIMLRGRPLGKVGRRERGRSMALVPQAETTSFDYSVLEYVLLGRSAYLPPLGMPGPEDRAAVRQVLDRLDLPVAEDHSVRELSGGEFQQVLLARALVQNPRVILMDEPASHLDPSKRFRFLELVQGETAAGRTVLMTTHDPQLALERADRAVLLRDGRAWRTGEARQVVTAENLAALYGLPVSLAEVHGRRLICWGG